MGRARLYFSVGPLCSSRTINGGGSVKAKCVRDSGAGKEKGNYKRERLY